MFTKNKYPIAISTEPKEADIVIKKQNGTVMYQGKSPATIILPNSDDIGKALYSVAVSSPGYETKVAYIDYKVDGVYYTNLLFPIFGWFIGMPFIDPASGAMWKPKSKEINIELQKEMVDEL